MKFESLTPWLFARTSGGIRWGLERTIELLAGVDDPHRRFASIHIGGTNGKGSVAAMCDAALRAEPSGRKIGLYTSPHLVSFTERIRINGRPVDDAVLLSAAERLRPAIESNGATFFEATTAIAFLCFAEVGVDLAVVEVGLGGRLDATNVIHPLVTAITNIALEHTEYLGDSLEAIAAEKAGILEAGVPAITAATGSALQVLRAEAERAGAPLVQIDEAYEVSQVSSSNGTTEIQFRGEPWGERELPVPLPGEHQARNALLAVGVLGLLPEEHRPGWTAIENGFGNFRWPGRVQLERIRGTTWIFDVAHNPAGVLTLEAALQGLTVPAPLVMVIGILSDKQWQPMLRGLLNRADAAILTIPDSAPEGRRWDPIAAAAWAEAECGVLPRVIPDLHQAIQRASTLAPHGTIVVTGSFHTVGDAMAVLGVSPF